MAKRTRLTRPYPIHTLEDALPIAETIQNVNGGLPVATDLLAKSLGTTVKSSAFVQKLKSSAGYGLTVGSHTSESIEVTPLGESLTAPRDEAARASALRDAALAPEVFGSFFEMYAGKRFPEEEFASNALVRDLSVHPDLAQECLRILRSNSLYVGLATERDDGLFVNPAGSSSAVADSEFPPAYDATGTRAAAPFRPVHIGIGPDDGSGAFGRDAAPLDDRSGASSASGDERARETATALIVAQPDDPLAEEARRVMDTLSLPVSRIELGSSASRPVPQETSDALRPARGCVIVWPSGDVGDAPDADCRILRARAWMTLGAASHLLGDKVIVVGDGGGDPELAAASEALDLTVIDGSDAAGVYPALMGALIAKSVVQVSWG